jgi:hypothetical protein
MKKKPYFLDKEFKLSVILDQTIEKLVSQCGEITKEMFKLALGSAWSFWMILVGCCHLSVCMLLSLKQDKEKRICFSLCFTIYHPQTFNHMSYQLVHLN